MMKEKEQAKNWFFRLVKFPSILVFSALLIFVAIHLSPEDPISLRIKNPDPTKIEAMRNELGLNDPLPIQFLHALTKFVKGDWGTSIITGRSVKEAVFDFFPATIELGIVALFLGTLFGVGSVLLSHVWDLNWLKKIVQGIGAIGLTIPIYWIGVLLILFFGVRLGWVPASGRFDFAHDLPKGTGFYLWDTLIAGDMKGFLITIRHLILPAITLSLYPSALIEGTLEGRLNDMRIQNLITALSSRGYSSFRIWGIHILRLLSGPIVTLLGTQIGTLLGGAILTETVFSWPGMGRYLVQGVLDRDIFLIQNGMLFVILLSLCIVAMSDLLTMLLNPSLKN